MLLGSVGLTATLGPTSVFTKLISEGEVYIPEMSQSPNGLSPFAGGLGVPDAWYTVVVVYGPADAGSARADAISANVAATAARDRCRLIFPPPRQCAPMMLPTGTRGQGLRRICAWTTPR